MSGLLQESPFKRTLHQKFQKPITLNLFLNCKPREKLPKDPVSFSKNVMFSKRFFQVPVLLTQPTSKLNLVRQQTSLFVETIPRKKRFPGTPT